MLTNYFGKSIKYKNSIPAGHWLEVKPFVESFYK